MFLIVGLGNPGKKYANTRHNIGFRVIDKLAEEKPRGVVLAKPKTYMNESGKAVKELAKRYKLKADNIIVIHDDIDLSLGKIKISKNRGSGGHKGVESVIKEIGTKDFYRIRIGICPQTGKAKNVEKFVLQNFSKEEKGTLKEAVGKAGAAIETLLA